MSVLFDEIDDHLVLSDNAALSLPDGDWSVALWLKLADNAGTAYQYFLSWSAVLANPSFNWYFNEAGGANPNKLEWSAGDGDTTDIDSITSATPGTSTAWQHLALVRSGSTIKQYVNASEVASASVANFGAINAAGNLYLGGRSDLNSGRFFGGYMADVAKWDRALSSAELSGLAGGKTALWYPTNLAWYLPLKADIAETIVPLTVTAAGGAAANAEHPTLADPPKARRRLLLCGAA